MAYYDPAYDTDPRPKPKGSPAAALLVLILVLFGAGTVIWFFVVPRIHNGLNPDVKPREVAQRGPLFNDEAELIKLYE
jgi:hypothetical protein